MRRLYMSFYLVIFAMAFGTISLDAQTRYVDVAPGQGTLNDAINGDTTATGERIDVDNTVYRLERGTEAYYLLEGSIENNFPLVIEAAEGDGARPFLQPAVVGDEASRAFRPKDNITLRDLHVTNHDNLGGQPTRMLRCSEDDIRVILDNCWFDRDGQAFIRIDNPGMTIKIMNCVVSNIGFPSDPANGRGIDDRGNDIDTLVIENSTFYNITSRVLRDDGGYIKSCMVKNNTFYNIGEHGITFGAVGELEVKNNIFMNAGFMPQDSRDPNYVLAVDSLAVDQLPGVTQTVSLMNNSFFMDTAKISSYFNDTTGTCELFNNAMNEFVSEAGTASSFLYENIDFEDAPAFNLDMVMYNMDTDKDPADAPFWVIPAVTSVVDGGNGVYHLDVPFSFNYFNSPAMSGGVDGSSIGDGNWTASPTVGVSLNKTSQATLKAYPMPIQNIATVEFELTNSGNVALNVYNILGARVATMVDEVFPAGKHSFTWDGASQLNTGVYFIRMDSNEGTSTLKVVVD